MRMIGKIGFALAILGLFTAGGGRARGAYLTNLPGSNDGDFVNIGAGVSYAVEFTTGSSPATLIDAQLRLTTQAPATDADVLTLYSASAGLPGTALTTFTTPPLGVGTSTDVFTTNFALAANTSYFLVLTGGAAFSQWTSTFTAANPNGVTPTSTAGVTYVTQLAGSGPIGGAPTSFSASAVIPNFQLDVAAVPEPSSLALVGLGGVAVLVGRRLRRGRSASPAL